MALKRTLLLLAVFGLVASTAFALDCPSTLDSECDDGNECTDDVCGVGNVCEYSATVCDDSIACTQDSCDTATGCVFTAFNALCDDNNACTGDFCRIISGGCVNQANPASWCDDGVACTDDECLPESGCVNRQNDLNCDDNDECTSNKCIFGQGCVFDQLSCDDADECTVDSCIAGVGCQNNAVSCDDGVACTVDSCDTVTGCAHAMDHNACDDSNSCSIDVCTATGCDHTDAGTCDDSNPCTADACNLVNGGGCVFTNDNSGTCNDNDLCTDNDRCVAGSCTGDSITCDDSLECTSDSCDAALGCQFTPEAAGTLCFIGGAVCDGSGTCIGCQNAGDCDDSDVCTFNQCLEHVCDYSTPSWAASEWTSWTHCDATCGTGASKRYRALLTGDASCLNQMEMQNCNTQACIGGECERRSLRYKAGTDQLVSTTCPTESPSGVAYDAQWCALNVNYMENGIPYWTINNINDGIGFGHTETCILPAP